MAPLTQIEQRARDLGADATLITDELAGASASRLANLAKCLPTDGTRDHFFMTLGSLRDLTDEQLAAVHRIVLASELGDTYSTLRRAIAAVREGNAHDIASFSSLTLCGEETCLRLAAQYILDPACARGSVARGLALYSLLSDVPGCTRADFDAVGERLAACDVDRVRDIDFFGACTSPETREEALTLVHQVASFRHPIGPIRDYCRDCHDNISPELLFTLLTYHEFIPALDGIAADENEITWLLEAVANGVIRPDRVRDVFDTLQELDGDVTALDFARVASLYGSGSDVFTCVRAAFLRTRGDTTFRDFIDVCAHVATFSVNHFACVAAWCTLIQAWPSRAAHLQAIRILSQCEEARLRAVTEAFFGARAQARLAGPIVSVIKGELAPNAFLLLAERWVAASTRLTQPAD